MKLLTIIAAAFIAFGLAAQAQDGWRLALPGWKYEFPRDHFSHSEFKTEWWYFTGNVATAEGKAFGYQFTLFRHGIRPPSSRVRTTSKLIINDISFGHLAVTDLSAKKFAFREKITRGILGQSGFSDGGKVAWINDWSIELLPDGRFRAQAKDGDLALDLTLRNAKPWIMHGANGVSQKSAGEGRASHYYSGVRLQTSGTLTTGGQTHAVQGESWFDHEWATNQLTAAQAGWDWFSIQLSNGCELMLYQLRLREGGSDAESSGTWIDAVGQTQHLARGDYTLTPIATWRSPTTGGVYPIKWEIRVPRLDLIAEVSTPLAPQELTLEAVAYWEGSIDLQGRCAGENISGKGYMELTGYAGPLPGLSEPAVSQ